MPPAFSSGSSSQLCRIIPTHLYCPACSTWRSRLARSGIALHRAKNRFASTLASATAVNATKSIPPKNRDLHQALNELRKKAPGQVSLSRLQLAIQGLESEHPTARIALLGANVPVTARRLIRLFLADASKPQHDWEARILGEDSLQNQDLIVRFGTPQNEGLQPASSILPVLFVPAPVLQHQGIEILISSVKVRDASTGLNGDTLSDVLLSPIIGTPNSAAGRQSLISQPVHRAAIVANGLDELVSVAELLAKTKFQSGSERRLVDIVLNLEGNVQSLTSGTITVDAAKAEEGLQVVRTDLAKASEFEKVWTESGMPALSRWLASSSAESSVGLSPLLRDLIASLLEAINANIAIQAQEARIVARSKAMTTETRLSLENAINTFSQLGHAELQSGLAAAWSSRNWRKLAFWKLFWRVDDVPLIVTDLVTTAWLPRTERAVYELTGRLKQAGVSMPSDSSTMFSPPQPRAIPMQADVKEKASSPVNESLILASTASTESVSTPLLPPSRTVIKTGSVPYRAQSLASTISTSRQAFIFTAITSLSSSAQQIVLKALTITGVSASLSALSFLSVTNGSIYESATVLALGTAYALRRMQREWEVQCKDLEHGLMEKGRSVLKQTEEHMRRLVNDASQVVEDEAEVRARREAIEAVEKAKLALAKHT
ncbi:hypothetical protein EPUS_01218 [Endocarpon pusillum Z07020]|uniref:Mmc1 C-terminal domain-containing protein n=1 Tax=Endocarpon pusillum (strain Z07020 / HMAS-L-300199) TaxID=1263415 RepID=U1GE15_ENDPU|nr:uncharacterized protein EPUS_01218 [Endocarpon pusillum Z07020]ERF75852.1 hypothetical protein EPUS_01218 [Endocarpon pusillum Z07020]